MSNTRNLPSAPGLAGRRTTPDHVAEALREAILTGQLEDGEELNQVALAEHFSISRVPVREALRQLQAEGLVRQEAHRRAVVSGLSLARLMELFDLRIRLETYMLERALVVITDEHLARMEKLLELMQDPAGEHSLWLERNRDFHQVLYDASGAVYTSELAGQIARRTTRYLYLRSGGEGIHRAGEADEEHRAILDAVRGRDLHRATHLLQMHIEGTRRRVREFFAARGLD